MHQRRKSSALRASFRHGDDGEPFVAGRVREPVVTRDKGQGLTHVALQKEAAGELYCVAYTQTVA